MGVLMLSHVIIEGGGFGDAAVVMQSLLDGFEDPGAATRGSSRASKLSQTPKLITVDEIDLHDSHDLELMLELD
jgi:hypothetical protein